MLTRPSTHFLDGTGLLLNDDNHTDLYLFVSCRYMHTRVSQKFHTSLSLFPSVNLEVKVAQACCVQWCKRVCVCVCVRLYVVSVLDRSRMQYVNEMVITAMFIKLSREDINSLMNMHVNLLIKLIILLKMHSSSKDIFPMIFTCSSHQSCYILSGK